MFLKLKIYLFIFCWTFLLGTPAVLATSNLNLGVDVYTCTINGVCDPGENSTYCLADCPTTVCNNNGTCDAGETNVNCPNDCHGGPSHTLNIGNISVTGITKNEAQINWTTDSQANCSLAWDITTDYLLGTLQETTGLNQLSHSHGLTGLSASTTYYFKISCIDTLLASAISVGNTFNTLSVDNVAPANVTDLTATPGNMHILLSWVNPVDLDFAGVMIRRSTVSTPAIGDGVEVYSGFGDAYGSKVSFDDTGLTNGTLYYYSVFAYDTSNNFASGVGVRATPRVATTTPQNVTNLRIVPNDSKLTLYWTNPSHVDFTGNVYIRRSLSGNPSFSTGDLVFSAPGYPFGAEFSFPDSGLTNDLRYYYTVFASYNSGEHASGVSISGIPSAEVIPSTTTPPYGTSTPPSTSDLLFRDFDFTQNNSRLEVLDGDVVNASTEQAISIGLVSSKIPAGTKKIILNLSVDGQIQSYPFAYDPVSGNYLAVLPGIVGEGKYWGTIIVLDESDKVIKTVFGWIQVTKPIIQEEEVPVIDVINEQIFRPIAQLLKPVQEIAKSPAGQAGAVAVAVASVANIAIAIPWWNLWTLLQFMFTQPILFYFRRKGWGTIYNSITKKPIDLALVRLYDARNGGLIASRVTDRAGRYSFLVDPGEYYLRVEKPKFEFPSKLLKQAPDDDKFVDLYYGDKIVVTHEGRSAIIANIPVDPADIKISDAEIIRHVSKEKLTTSLSWVGPILALIYFALFPSIFAGVIVLIHLVIRLIFGRLSQKRTGKYWGVVYDQNLNKPIKKAVARVYSSEYGRMLEFYVTDDLGRYSFLVGGNKYYVTGDKEGYNTTKTPIIDLTKTDTETAYIAKDLALHPTTEIDTGIQAQSNEEALLPESIAPSATETQKITEDIQQNSAVADSVTPEPSAVSNIETIEGDKESDQESK